MNIIQDVEKKIKHITSMITYAQKQLNDYEKGILKLSHIALASTEESIDKNKLLLEKYTLKLDEMKTQNFQELMEKEKKKEEIRKNNYFKYQKIRLKRDTTKSEEEIEEALMILCELPEEMELQDCDIFEISKKSQDLYLLIHWDLHSELNAIKEEFLLLTQSTINERNGGLRILNYLIPIIILQLSVLFKNIEENLKDAQFNTFTGFPKFQDWWIRELWHSHQAYLAFFKWKQIILNLCITDEQKKAFEAIFKSWLYVKKILDTKGEYSYSYNNAFDTLICKYGQLEEEKSEKNLISMKNIVKTLTEKTNLNTVSSEHTLITPYMQFKLNKKLALQKDEEDKKS